MNLKPLYQSILIALFLVPLLSGTAGAESTRIGILPFTITSESGLDYLSVGIIDLMSSRLSLKNEVTIVDKQALLSQTGTAPIDTNKAREAGTSAGADFIITGSLTESVKGIEITATVIDVANGNEALAITEKSGNYETSDVIIPLINRATDKIKQGLFSKETVETVETIDLEESRNIHEHPDKLIPTLELEPAE